MKRKILLFFLFFVLFAFTFNAKAQEIKISGTIKDSNGTPLIGISVTIKGTYKGTNSDTSGNFSITAAIGSTLSFSMLNMVSQAVIITAIMAKSPLQNFLIENVQSLSQVVGGYSTKKNHILQVRFQLLAKRLLIFAQTHNLATSFREKLEIFRNGKSQNYQLSVSGGNEKTLYYLAGRWTQNQGAVRSSDMDRANFKVNLAHTATDWFKTGTNLAYTHYRDVSLNDNQAVNQGGVILGALSTPPIIEIYNTDGTFTSNTFQDWETPIASTDGVSRSYKNQRIIGNVYAELNFIPELKLQK